MNFIINKEEFLQVVAAWKQIPNRNATDHIFYNALRGFDLKRGFGPITTESKLANGATPWQSFDGALRSAAFQLRAAAIYPNMPPDRKAKQEAERDERMNALGKKFGVIFTPELIAKLVESFK